MPETRFPYLCGGVLYFLLAQTKASRGTARDHRNGIKDDHSDPIMMGDLIYTFTGSTNFGASKDTSLYRECGSEGSINVPFNDPAMHPHMTAQSNSTTQRPSPVCVNLSVGT